LSEQGSSWADPAALGLAGFGLTTTALSLHNVGVIDTAGYTLAYGFMYGGLAQVIAGIIEFRRSNILGGTAFTSYGLFWIGFSLLNLLEALGLFSASPGEIAAWMALWGLFTLYMTVAAAKLGSRAVTVVLTLLTLLFLLLAATFASGSSTLKLVAGA
jgi:hypothetical protein